MRLSNTNCASQLPHYVHWVAAILVASDLSDISWSQYCRQAGGVHTKMQEREANKTRSKIWTAGTDFWTHNGEAEGLSGVH
jgi:hypothetical protein